MRTVQLIEMILVAVVQVIYEKSRSGNKAGAIHVQMYKTTQIQLETIFTQSEARLLLYVLKSAAGSYQLKIQREFLLIEISENLLFFTLSKSS